MRKLQSIARYYMVLSLLAILCGFVLYLLLKPYPKVPERALFVYNMLFYYPAI